MADELDYLILGAHPDDAELFCGGSIVKWLRRGCRVGVADLTRGEAGSSGTPEIRAREAAVASQALGLTWRRNLGLPDSHLADDQAGRKAVVTVIRETRAKVVIAPLAPCRHPDHSAVHYLARSGCFFAGNNKFDAPHAPWRPLRLLFHPELQPVTPSFVVDVSAEFEAKLAALRCYASQFFTPETGPKPTLIGAAEFIERVTARAAYYGSLINCRYGEAFVIEGGVRVDDPLRNLREG